MAGLQAAVSLLTADADVEVTIVQRGWRLGGKGASHRAGGRIEEHGLHVWPGYYDNAFRTVGMTGGDRSHREVIESRFVRSPIVGLPGRSGDRPDGRWEARFTTDDRIPGEGSVGGPSVADLMVRSVSLIADLTRSASGTGRRPGGRIRLSGSPYGPRAPLDARRLVTAGEAALWAAVIHATRLASAIAEGADSRVGAVLVEALAEIRHEAQGRRHRFGPTAPIEEVVDLVLTAVLGAWRDGLLTDPAGFAAVNDRDFREWLAEHGAHPASLDGALVGGMYDLVFGYRGGEHHRPAFEAGTGLALAGRFFFAYRGALFWKMRAGMGETVFAPLYRFLVERGARFLFFHRLERLRLDPTGRMVERVELARQARLRPGVTEYRPLIDEGEWSVFPAEPLLDQLDHDRLPLDLEHHHGSRAHETPIHLERGHHFDRVILATSIGMLPHVCGEIVDRDERWAAMLASVGTVATQALQLWTRPDEAELGWSSPGATVAGFPSPFDTYASMSHLLAVESHRGDESVGAIGYFCSVLPDRIADTGSERATEIVGAGAVDYMNERLGVHWPNAVADGRFRWDLLAGSTTNDESAFRSQYHRANTDPSDRYVQSLPGSGKARLRADDSGVENLFLAGDWIDSGINAGCIEAAVVAGIQAANACLGRPLTEGVIGGWAPVNPARAVTDG